MTSCIWGRGTEGFLYGTAGGNGNNLGGLAVSDTAAHVGQIVAGPTMIIGFSLQLVTTGTLTGSWKIEFSNDYFDNGSAPTNQPQNAGDWVDMTAKFSATNFFLGPAAISQPAGSATDQFLMGSFVRIRAIRVTFTAASGSGTVQALCTAETFG